MEESPSRLSPAAGELVRLRDENAAFRAQLEDAQETLRAIQQGAVDALVIDTPEGQRVFTLQGTDQTYRHLLEQMREGAAMLTADGTIHFCNRGLADLLQRPLEQVIGTPILAHVAPAQQPVFQTLLRDGLADHAGYEVDLLAADGGTVPVQIGLSPLVDEHAATLLSMIVFDLTERKQAEMILANEQQFRSLAESIPHLVWSARPDGFSDYYNLHLVQVLAKQLHATLAVSSTAGTEFVITLPGPVR